MRTRWQREYRALLAEYPEFIDVYQHLALLLDETGREEEALQLWREAVALGFGCLPESFSMGRDRLAWGYLDNRPFLRTYHSYGLWYLERGEVETALSIFSDILSLNPNDNQGVRGLVIQCYFGLGWPGRVLEVCGSYPDDIMESVLYGRPLALYQQGRQPEAKEALLEAIDHFPLIARELVKTRHRRPKDLRPDRITLGGADQAYYYWTEEGGFWKNTPGAIDLVRECLQEVAGE